MPMDSTELSCLHGLPLSIRQREIFLEHTIEPAAPLHNIGGWYWIDGAVDPHALEQAVKDVIARSDTLRLVLRHAYDGQFPSQVILPSSEFSLAVVRVNSDHDAIAWMNELAKTPFPMFDCPLFRFVLVSVSETRNAFAMIFHHIVADGATMDLTMERIAALYPADGAEMARRCDYPAFRDLVIADNDYLKTSAYERAGEYWKGRFSSLPAPLFHQADDAIGYRGAEAYVQEIDLPRSVHGAFTRNATGPEGNAFHAMIAAIHGYFGRRQGVDDVVLGISLLNRTTPSQKQTIGLATSVAPIRLAGGFGLSFSETVHAVSAELRRAYRHHRYPLSAINQKIGLYRAGRERLFDVTISYLVSSIDRLSLGASSVGSITQLLSGYEQKPLQIYINDMDAERPVRISLVYNRGYFEAESIDSIGHGLVEFIKFFAEHPEATLLDGPLMTPLERDRIVRGVHDWTDLFPEAQCAHELIDACARKNPAAVALLCDNHALSYAALTARANQVAHYLRSIDVGPDTVVGLVADRSVNMVIGLLGILKAGGAYLPLDPHYPAERQVFMLQDARVSTVLVGSADAKSRVSMPEEVRVVSMDADAIDGMPTVSPATQTKPDNLAYVIYTSGSSGKPKGVLVPHRGLCNLLTAQARLFDVQPGERVLQFARLSFDASMWEIGMALSAGATLVIARDDELIPGAQLAKTLRDHRINIATLPPSVLPFLEEYSFPALRTVVSAGEACPIGFATRWAAKCKFVNAYGPTEVTVCASAGQFEGGNRVAIGWPIAYTRLYVLNDQLAPVPVGVAGELYIAGAGVARGYLRQPAMSAARFVANPFEVGGRMYRSGDRVRILTSGALEFLGRCDNQVKRRGFRIELGEIEQTLLTHPSVQQALVINKARTEQDSDLVAYVTLREAFVHQLSGAGEGAADERAVSSPLLKAHLLHMLPEHMMPNFIVILERMPMTENGKIDRAALHLSTVRPVAPVTQESVSGSIDGLVSSIWTEVLGQEHFAPNANFFDLGGDSLRLARVLQLVNSKLGLELTFVSLLRHPTIASLSSHIRTHQSQQGATSNGVPAPGERAGMLRGLLNRIAGEARVAGKGKS